MAQAQFWSKQRIRANPGNTCGLGALDGAKRVAKSMASKCQVQVIYSWYLCRVCHKFPAQNRLGWRQRRARYAVNIKGFNKQLRRHGHEQRGIGCLHKQCRIWLPEEFHPKSAQISQKCAHSKKRAKNTTKRANKHLSRKKCANEDSGRRITKKHNAKAA